MKHLIIFLFVFFALINVRAQNVKCDHPAVLQPNHPDFTRQNNIELEFYSHIVAALDPFLRKSRYNKYGMEFYLQGIYIKNNVLFLSYYLKNHTRIKYDEASLRFFLRDKRKVKRTAVQDTEQKPLHVLHTGLPEDCPGQNIVIAFPKFSMAEAKYLSAELMEINGDRNPVSSLDQSVLLKAKNLQ